MGCGVPGLVDAELVLSAAETGCGSRGLASFAGGWTVDTCVSKELVGMRKI